MSLFIKPMSAELLFYFILSPFGVFFALEYVVPDFWREVIEHIKRQIEHLAANNDRRENTNYHHLAMSK